SSQLLVTNGGLVSDAVASVGVLAASSNNTAIMRGPGSSWSNSVLLVVGSNGPANSLIVSNGSTVFANALIIGNNASSTNNTAALVNAQMNVTNLAGTASLDVRRGSFLFNGGALAADRFLLTN